MLEYWFVMQWLVGSNGALVRVLGQAQEQWVAVCLRCQKQKAGWLHPAVVSWALTY